MINITNNRRGAYIVILALIFPACLFVMGALIDIGLLYATRARLQDVADAAALSGAQSLTKGDKVATDAAKFFFAGKEDKHWNSTIQGWVTSVSGAPDNLINFSSSTIQFSENGKAFANATVNSGDGVLKNRYIKVSLSAHPKSLFLESAVKVFNLDPIELPTITVQSIAFNQGYSSIFSSEDLSIKTWSASLSGLVHTNANLEITGLKAVTRPADVSAFGSISDTSGLLHNSKEAKQSMPKITQYTTEGNTDMLKAPYNSPSISIDYLKKRGFTSAPDANKPNVFMVDNGDMTITCDTPTDSNTSIYATFYAPNGTVTIKGSNDNTAYILNLRGSIVAKKVIIDLPKGTFTISPFETTNPPAVIVR